MLRVLIVDDEPIFCRCLRDFLAKDGYYVESVLSSSAAISVLQRSCFDVILLDVCLPQISGVTLMKMIKTRNPYTSIIMMTGYTSKSMAAECMSNGAHDFLYKPFHLNVVTEILKELHQRKERWLSMGIIDNN